MRNLKFRLGLVVLVMVIGVGSTGKATAERIGFWRFNEGAGESVADSSSYGNDGYLGTNAFDDTGDPTWTDGKYGAGLDFDGIDDCVSIPLTASLKTTDTSNQFTLEAWVKFDTLPGGEDIIIERNLYSTYRFETFGSGKLGAWVGYKWYTTPGAVLTTGVWEHVALVFDGVNSNFTYYVNGTSVYSVVTLGPIGSDNEPVRIGGPNYPSDSFLSGKIDEVQIWNEARTEAEIQLDIIPEPNTLLLMSIGVMSLGGIAFWRKKQ